MWTAIRFAEPGQPWVDAEVLIAQSLGGGLPSP